MRSILLLVVLLLLPACGKTDPSDTGDSEAPLVDGDEDGFASDIDCDDGNVSINPGADEECDGVDNDCDGFVDDEDPNVVDQSTWYPDGDGDGWGTEEDADAVFLDCDGASGFVDQGGDCDDDNEAVYPGADEICDGEDNDCNDIVDDADDALTFYEDSDGDGWGDDGSTLSLCEAQSGWVAEAGDCDDNDNDIHPDADELCDGIDNNCDDAIDGDDAVDPATWYIDNDGDGYGHNGRTAESCEQPSGYVAQGDDCDDGLSSVNPGADETCNEVDDDCDGLTDNSPVDGVTWYRDSDGDGYGSSTTTRDACEQPSGYVSNSEDCDDTRPAVNPSVDEYCDGMDNDCDGVTDEDDAVNATTWYSDGDGDGFGDDGISTRACSQPSGYEALANDCDDSDPAINPSADERCDGVDNDCDGDDDDDRTVTFLDASGTSTDLTSTFMGSSSTSIVSYTVSSSGTLVFCPGTYYAHLELTAATVSIEGLYGSADTKLSGGGSGVVIDASSTTTDLSIEGLLLKGGYGDAGGAILGQASGLALTLDDCELTLNAAVDGAAIWVDGADVVITSSDFSDNDADEFGGAVAAYDSDVAVYDSTFEDNVARRGGALWLSGGSLLLDGTLVQDNTANASLSSGEDSAAGGGAYLVDGATLECSATSSASAGFLSNVAFGEAGAVYQSTGSTVTSTLCDWGTDSSTDDNTPTDIYVEGADTRYAYGDNASFGCDDAGCS